MTWEVYSVTCLPVDKIETTLSIPSYKDIKSVVADQAKRQGVLDCNKGHTELLSPRIIRSHPGELLMPLGLV